MAPNNGQTGPQAANPEATHVSSRWLSGDVFLSDIGINSESSTALLPDIELRRKLEDLEAESREVSQRLARIQAFFERNLPVIESMLPPGDRAQRETQQNPPHGRPDPDALLRSQREAHRHLLSERTDFDTVFPAWRSNEAQRKVLDAQRQHLTEKREIAAARSDLTELELARHLTDPFTSAEDAAAILDSWSRRVRPENAELANRFQEVAGTLKEVAGKKDLIRLGRFEMLEQQRRFAASESFIDQRVAIEEARLSDRKFLRLLAAEAREITPSLESRLKHIDDVLRHQVSAQEEFLVNVRRSATARQDELPAHQSYVGSPKVRKTPSL
jgi:hypothetical protein